MVPFGSAVRRYGLMSNAERVRKLVGGRITKIRLNPIEDGRGGRTYQPEIFVRKTNGETVRLFFFVRETEVGEYGLQPVIVGKE